MDVSRRTLVGVALIALGTLLYVPGAFPATGALALWGLALGTATLVAGVYLVGTDVEGRVV